MIIWLASYPRSGSTLFRTIVKQTMGVGSYTDELPPPNIGFGERLEKKFGQLNIPDSWETYYEKAKHSDKVVLIKTHLPPRDGSPTIYIVRDGRKSLISYYKYHKEFFPEYSGGLLNLVLGVDYYGGWSNHYANWNVPDRKVLLLRYEDLISATAPTLSKIAHFIGYTGEPKEWLNVFDQLHAENPRFFRAGKAEWQKTTEWSEVTDSVFMLLHGDLMLKLGYIKKDRVRNVSGSLGKEFVALVKLVQSIQCERELLEKTCGDRLTVIKALEEKLDKSVFLGFSPQRLMKRLSLWGR